MGQTTISSSDCGCAVATCPLCGPSLFAAVEGFLTANGRTHTRWADWFEANPEKEREYVATGEWDSAAEHRRLEAGYRRAVALLRSLRPRFD